MSSHHDFLDDDELTAEERGRFAALPRDRAPSDMLEHRTRAALRDRGLLRRRESATRVVTLVVAASVIFIAGALVGYVAARRSPPPVAQPTVANNRQSVAQVDTAVTPTATRHVVWY